MGGLPHFYNFCFGKEKNVYENSKDDQKALIHQEMQRNLCVRLYCAMCDLVLRGSNVLVELSDSQHLKVFFGLPEK